MAVNHHSEPDGGPDGRDQAYRMVAELLVGFRRIVLRGLQRVCGDDWLETGCPREVRDRIRARQEAEKELDRFSAEGDDIFAYANFADLADVVESVPEVAGLMRSLASSPDRLSANLRSLEEVRAKIAAIRPVSESEQVALAEMHLRLREKLAGARRRAQGEEPNDDLDPVGREAAEGTSVTTQPLPEPAPQAAREPTAPVEPPPEPEQTAPVEPPREAKPTAAVEPPPAPHLPPKRPAVREAKNAATAQRIGTPGRTTASPPARRPSRLSVAASASEEQQRRRVYDPVGAAVLDGAPTPVGLVQVDEGDLSVLRDLRREMIAAAEAAYAHAEAIGMEVWTTAWDSGWFSRKLERYGLGEVATFYAVMEQYLDRRHKGYTETAMRNFLADRELAKLLLRLRELFLRLKV